MRKILVAAVCIPPIIWSYWDAGLKNAPEIIHACIKSWRNNSGIDDIRILNDSEVFNYLSLADLPRTFYELPAQKKANAIRLALLVKYGGFWLDASIFVRGNLVVWAETHQSPDGLLVFQDPGPDRFLSNWFLACVPHHRIMSQLQAMNVEFFKMKRIHNLHLRRGEAGKWTYRLTLILNRKFFKQSKLLVTLWTRFPANRLPFYPYFIFHYLANRVILSGGNRSTLKKMTYLPALDAMATRHFLRGKDPQVDVSALLRGNMIPLQKLSHNRPLFGNQIEQLSDFDGLRE
jgi:hypothetical protein